MEYDTKVETCLDELCCGFRCSNQITICSDDTKMFRLVMEDSLVEDEDSCCVSKRYCKDYMKDIEEACVYTKGWRPLDQAIEPFEADWKKYCCEEGFKCSDVKELDDTWCKEFGKYYDRNVKESGEILQFPEIYDDVRSLVADLCCVDIRCTSDVCGTEIDSRMKDEMSDVMIPTNVDSFEYCCGYDCTNVVVCDEFQMLPLRNPSDLPLQAQKKDCCDVNVTTCDAEKDVLDCGDGFRIRQDQSDFSVLIYQDKMRETCCEKKEEEKKEVVVEKKECCERKGPLVQVRYFQSPNVLQSPPNVLMPYDLSNSAALRGALNELADAVDEFVGDDDNDDNDGNYDERYS